MHLVRNWQILLQKSFSTADQNFSSPLVRFSDKYVRDLDYVIVDGGRYVGRLYEDRHSRPASRWLWAITIYVNPQLGIPTSGRAPSLEQAKAQFLANWRKDGGQHAST